MSEAIQRLIDCFADTFAEQYRTELRGGASEPLYQPGENGEPHRIFFREDYFSSALHEVAHWCVAGEARRQQLDYGYWYAPDGRDAGQQKLFERVEAKPQALEWLFSRACGRPFRVSIDNLDAAPVDAFGFQLSVWQALNNLGCPQNFRFGERAAQFIAALAAHFEQPSWTDLAAFDLWELRQ